MNSATLKTDRLILRPIQISDVDEIFFLRSDSRILKYLDIPPAKSSIDVLKFIEKIKTGTGNKECYYWGITIKPKENLVGTICLWNISDDKKTADIGYVLHPDFQGKGFMQEAISEVINTGFEVLNLTTIDADVDPENLKSIALLEKKGFTFKKFDKTVIYSLLKK